MLLQTNSYVVPKERRAEHARLLRRFRQTLVRLGCENFEVYEQVGSNWNADQSNGRFVQIMRFRDRRQQLAVQAAERTDPAAQQLIAEFCELINFPYQQQHGLFAVGFYSSLLPVAPARREADDAGEPGEGIRDPETIDPTREAEQAARQAAAYAAAEVAPPDQQTYGPGPQPQPEPEPISAALHPGSGPEELLQRDEDLVERGDAASGVAEHLAEEEVGGAHEAGTDLQELPPSDNQAPLERAAELSGDELDSIIEGFSAEVDTRPASQLEPPASTAAAGNGQHAAPAAGGGFDDLLDEHFGRDDAHPPEPEHAHPRHDSDLGAVLDAGLTHDTPGEETLGEEHLGVEALGEGILGEGTLGEEPLGEDALDIELPAELLDEEDLDPHHPEHPHHPGRPESHHG